VFTIDIPLFLIDVMVPVVLVIVVVVVYVTGAKRTESVYLTTKMTGKQRTISVLSDRSFMTSGYVVATAN